MPVFMSPGMSILVLRRSRAFSEDVLLEIKEVALRAGHIEGEALLVFHLRPICDLGKTLSLDNLH